MPLRLLEITVPEDRSEGLMDLLADREIRVHSTAEAPDGARVARVVVPTSHTEALTDALTDRFGSTDLFRVLILSIEATLPPEAEQEDEPADPPTDDGRPPPDRVSREELYQDVSSAAALTPVYLATVALSTAVAAAGLIRGDVAVIIGAMVIAPLLGPNVAFALGISLGDSDLMKHAAKASAAGVAVAFALSLAAGAVFPIDPTVDELANRTRVGLADLAIALAAGSAGSLAYTSGLPTAIIGVMVAVALLPPLVAAGLLLGTGEPELAAGSAVLTLVNFTCINLAAVATFFARRVRPRTWWESEKAKRAMRVAVTSWLILLGVLIAVILFLNRG